MRSSEVARHYARVLFETASAAGDDLEELAQGLEELAKSLVAAPELAVALASRGISRARRAKLVEAVSDRLAPGSRLGRFAAVMVERERAGDLPETARAFRAALDVHHGVVEAEVVSARPLDRTRRTRLREAFGGKARLRFSEDPKLLGGLVVRTSNRIYDASVSGELLRFSGRCGLTDSE